SFSNRSSPRKLAWLRPSMSRRVSATASGFGNGLEPVCGVACAPMARPMTTASSKARDSVPIRNMVGSPFGEGGLLGWGLVQLQLDFVAHDAHRVTAGLEARVVRPGPVRQPKTPGVPGTGHDAIFHVALAQRSAHVGADVVDREILLAHPEQGDQFVADFDRLAFPVGHVSHPTHDLKLGHKYPFLKPGWT